GADDLRLAAQAVRILNAIVAVQVRAADLAAREQGAVVARDVDLPRLAAQRVDARVERAVAAARRVDGERADDERRLEHRLEGEQREPFLGGEREGGDADALQHLGRRTANAVDDELALADQRQRQVRERREI